MSHCQCQGIESIFDDKSAEKSLKQYQKKGPSKTTGLLIDVIQKQEPKARNLLDIGGGIGAIHFALLEAGIQQATLVEASKASAHVAREETNRRGFGERVSFEQGDFTEISDSISECDIVTLDRVICCYDNMQELVSKSSKKARKLYGVVYPRDIWLTRTMVPLLNLFSKLRGNSFRVFVHPVAEVDSIIRSSGLSPIFAREFIFWQVVVYSK